MSYAKQILDVLKRRPGPLRLVELGDELGKDAQNLSGTLTELYQSGRVTRVKVLVPGQKPTYAYRLAVHGSQPPLEEQPTLKRTPHQPPRDIAQWPLNSFPTRPSQPAVHAASPSAEASASTAASAEGEPSVQESATGAAPSGGTSSHGDNTGSPRVPVSGSSLPGNPLGVSGHHPIPHAVGWLCPACGAGNAPWVATCACSGWRAGRIFRGLPGNGELK